MAQDEMLNIFQIPPSETSIDEAFAEDVDSEGEAVEDKSADGALPAVVAEVKH